MVLKSFSDRLEGLSQDTVFLGQYCILYLQKSMHLQMYTTVDDKALELVGSETLST